MLSFSNDSHQSVDGDPFHCSSVHPGGGGESEGCPNIERLFLGSGSRFFRGRRNNPRVAAESALHASVRRQNGGACLDGSSFRVPQHILAFDPDHPFCLRIPACIGNPQKRPERACLHCGPPAEDIGCLPGLRGVRSITIGCAMATICLASPGLESNSG